MNYLIGAVALAIGVAAVVAGMSGSGNQLYTSITGKTHSTGSATAGSAPAPGGTVSAVYGYPQKPAITTPKPAAAPALVSA
jgi:hypothetical protein